MGIKKASALTATSTSTLSAGGASTGPAFITATSNGTVTTFGNYTIHTFLSSGTFTVTAGINKAIEYLIVAGGGGGTSGGGTNGPGSGGGAGGFIESYAGQVFGSDFSGPRIFVNKDDVFTITIGAGGTNMSTSPSAANKGVNSSIVGSVYSATALGGGSGGASSYYSQSQHCNGGSGGGGNGSSNNFPYSAAGIAVAKPRQGYDGLDTTSGASGGGAGGSGTAGQNDGINSGGPGRASSITGSSVTYAKGGHGSFNTSAAPVVGPANSGQGGGAGTSFSGGSVGKNGGSGIVIIRYLFQ